LPRRPSITRRTTIYSLKRAEQLADCITGKYRNSAYFTLRSASVDNVEGLLVTGTIEREKTDWSAVLSAYTGETVSLGNRNAVAVLLLPMGARVFALAYGMGFLILDQSMVDQGFGLRFAVRKLDPERVKTVTRYILEQGARVDRNSVPSGQRVEDFAIEEYGEIINRLAGPSAAQGLTFTQGRTVSFSLSASDSLGLPIGKGTQDLLNDLREIARVVDSDPPVPELAFIGQLRALKPQDARISELDARLNSQLDEHDRINIALAFPWEGDEERGEAQSYRIKVPGGHRGGVVVSEITLESLLEALSEVSCDDRVAVLKKSTIQAFEDEEAEPAAAISRAIPASKWVSAEIMLGSSRLFFRDGRWYEVGKGYVDHLRRRVDEIMSQPSPVRLPAWQHGEDEDVYDKRVGNLPEFVCLDRQSIRTEAHPRGIEPCDLLAPDGVLIHVKQAAKSAPLSHLFAQAMVSAEQLLFDEYARTRLRELVRERKPAFTLPEDWQPRHVVFGIALKRGLSSERLFTFSQVVLVRCVDRLRLRQLKVSVIGIPFAQATEQNDIDLSDEELYEG
jgi:uncharacterized protein (TIGR04141 family)